jgi:hypothetical protein
MVRLTEDAINAENAPTSKKTPTSIASAVAQRFEEFAQRTKISRGHGGLREKSHEYKKRAIRATVRQGGGDGGSR